MIGGVGKIEIDEEAARPTLNRNVRVKSGKKRSKSNAVRKALLKNKNIIDLKKEKLRLKLEASQRERERKKKIAESGEEATATTRPALSRFMQKKRD